MNTSNYSWQCATCGRQVPRKVDTCRCGFVRPAAAPEPPGALPVDPSPEPVRSGPNPLLVGLFLGLSVAAGMLFYLKEEAPPPQAAVAAPADEAPFEGADVAEPPVSDAELTFPADTSFAAV